MKKKNKVRKVVRVAGWLVSHPSIHSVGLFVGRSPIILFDQFFPVIFIRFSFFALRDNDDDETTFHISCINFFLMRTRYFSFLSLGLHFNFSFFLFNFIFSSVQFITCVEADFRFSPITKTHTLLILFNAILCC